MTNQFRAIKRAKLKKNIEILFERNDSWNEGDFERVFMKSKRSPRRFTAQGKGSTFPVLLLGQMLHFFLFLLFRIWCIFGHC